MNHFNCNPSIFYSKKLGILGGGQLGRMLAIAAYNLGMQVVIFTNKKDSPASYITNSTIVANYDDTDALLEFARKVDVITLEFENIPTAVLDFLVQYTNVYPSARALNITQNRLREKRFVNNLDIATTVFEEVNNLQDLTIGYPCILKTLSSGYDGKGQCTLHSITDQVEVEFPCIAEKAVYFQKEISVIIARDLYGNIETFPIAENVHKNGILCTSIVPADIKQETIEKAYEIATKIITAVDYIGVMTVEFFVIEGEELLVNEIAPRVHNSGHWSIEACNVSQFEQHIRAVCGLPIKPIHLYFPCKMHNIIGEDIQNIKYDLHSERITIYGKQEVLDGRKMGHITIPNI